MVSRFKMVLCPQNMFKILAKSCWLWFRSKTKPYQFCCVVTGTITTELVTLYSDLLGTNKNLQNSM